MHSVILEDDGFPELYKKIREIRVDVGAIDFNNYQGMMLLRNQDKPQIDNISSSKSKDSKS